jgi:aryl-alcohol dehydrogenase-like predicted oxidoreductase
MTEQRNEKPSIAGLARVRLGHSQLTVRPVGLGCMGISQFYGAADDNESINTLREAIDLGVNFLDTSDIYGAADIGLGASIRGFGHNEQLIGQAIAGRRDEVLLATKFAAKLNGDHRQVIIDGRPEYVQSACEASLCRRVTATHRPHRTRTTPEPSGTETSPAVDEPGEAGKDR